MLEEKDIEKIGEEMGKVIEQNITPVLDEMKDDINVLKNDVSIMKTEMVTKSYLDDKMADLEGTLIVKLRKEDNKVNRLIDLLKKKSYITEKEAEQFGEFQIFPKA